MENGNGDSDLETLEVTQRNRMNAAGESGIKNDMLNHYKDIAGKYDKFVDLTGWLDGRREIAAALHCVMPEYNARILDCGCGTGQTAQEIKKLGFNNIDGLDMSLDMLDVANSKDIFKQVICGSIGVENQTGIPYDCYDAVVCNGTFMPGQMDQTCFPELTRITKSGGYIVFSVSLKYLQGWEMFQNGRLDEAIEQCIASGKWKAVDKEIRPYWRNEQALYYIAHVA